MTTFRRLAWESGVGFPTPQMEQSSVLLLVS